MIINATFPRLSFATWRREEIGIKLDQETCLATCDVPCPFNPTSLRINEAGGGPVLCTAINLKGIPIQERGYHAIYTRQHFPRCAFPSTDKLPTV